MSEGLLTRAHEGLRSARRFFAHDVWQKRLHELPRGQALRYLGARISYCTFRGLFFEESLQIRAAALTYFTVLSLVPLLAFAFALLKGFGAYQVLIEESIRPYVVEQLAGNAPLRRAFETLLQFVEQTGVTSLGFIGLLFLLYAATRLLRNVEGALNEIWGARSARDLLEQLRDYVAIIVVTPLSLMAAAALGTWGQALPLLRVAEDTLGVTGLAERAVSVIGPLAVLFLGLMFLYTVLPNVKVKLRSAAVGAVIGGLIWYVVLVIHVRFQVGVARFNALYAGFAAIPIFLAWLQVSWLVVLIGAQIASVHQHHKSMATHRRLANANQAFKEAIALSAVLQVLRAFGTGAAHPTREQLSEQLDAPEELLAELFERLVAAGVLVEIAAPHNPAYSLAKAPELIYVKDLIDALRRSSTFNLESAQAEVLDPTAKRIWLELDQALAGSPANCTLRELIVRDGAAAEPGQ